MPPRLGEDRPASRPLWGRGCPFFALQGPAQAEREASGPTVWRTPQTSPFSGAPPIPAPRRCVPSRRGTCPIRPLRQRWGEPGPAQCPRKSWPPLGAWWCQQSEAGTLVVLPLGYPWWWVCRSAPHPTPSAFCSWTHPVHTQPAPLPWTTLEPRRGPCGVWPRGPPAALPQARSPRHPLPRPPASPGPWRPGAEPPFFSSGAVIVTSLLCLKR